MNLTFRFEPPKDIVSFASLPAEAREDVRGYVEQLAQHSAFWRSQLESEAR